MPPWPRQFFSDSATQIPNDIDFARSFHHPVSAAAPQLSDSRVPGRCPFFRCSPGPANSVPDLSAGLSAAPKPEGVTDEQWVQQKGLQKGLALSSLGQVNIEKKDNAQALENLKAAAPLLKPDDGSYARNQYRLGFALLNLKRTAEAKEAFTQAASVNSPYKALAQEKLRDSARPASARKKAP